MAYSSFGIQQRRLDTDAELSFRRPGSPNASVWANRPVNSSHVDQALLKGLLHRTRRTSSVLDVRNSFAQRR